jgi:hypothetical protein
MKKNLPAGTLRAPPEHRFSDFFPAKIFKV